MRKFFTGINSFFKADWWTGGSWLMVLCVLQVALITVYLICHGKKHTGYEYVQLNTDQLKTFNDLAGIYPDAQPPTTVLKKSLEIDSPVNVYRKRVYDSTTNVREQRTGMIKKFLRTVYKSDEKDDQQNQDRIDKELADINSSLMELNTRDVTTFVTSRKFKVDSYFWLAGAYMYWEAIFWSFFGVITSLIYYVSLANQLALKKKAGDDIGPFETSEISAQVAKMFYAPAITLVIVLGYNFFSGKNQGAVDISVNHGLILFAFLAGFYSGRLMKLLDGLKNLALPISSDGPSTRPGTTPTTGTGDIRVTLKLADSMANNPAAASITEGGFNTATVTLEPVEGKGDVITLDRPAEDQGSTFTGSKIPYGKYTVKARYAFDNRQSVINLTGSQDIEVSATSLAFTVPLSQESSNG